MEYTRRRQATESQMYWPPDGSPSELELDPQARDLSITGQNNPLTDERWRAWHGRQLAGFGEATPMNEMNVMRDHYVEGLETNDDVEGSGIFDSASRATVHADMGVFADHPSLPGYIARNLPFNVSRDVADLPTDGEAEVVEVPAGGMFYVERDGHLFGPTVTGPTPPPQPIAPQYASSRYQPYEAMTKQAIPLLPPHMATRDVPMSPSARPVPYATSQRTIGAQSITNPSDGRMAIGGFGLPVLADQWDTSSVYSTSGKRYPAMYTPRYLSSGYGEDPAPAKWGWGTYAFAGAVVGVAAAMLVGATKMGGKKGRVL